MQLNRRGFIKTATAGALALLVPIGIVKDVLCSEPPPKPIPLNFKGSERTITFHEDDLCLPPGYSKYIKAAAKQMADQIDEDIANLYLKAI